MNKETNWGDVKVFMMGVEITGIKYITYNIKTQAAVSRMKGFKKGIAVVKGNRKALKQDTSWG